MKPQIRRRDFLQKAALLTVGLFTLSELALAANSTKSFSEMQNPMLNPAFRISNHENGEVELYTHLQDKSKLSEVFAGLDADIIVEIAHERNPLVHSEKLAFRYNLSNLECKDKIENLLNDLQESRIIYYGEKMLVKIHEA